MCWIQTIIILILLSSVENFNLIQNKIRSRLHNPSYALKSNISKTRVSRTCFVNCNLILKFNQSIVQPETCNGTQIDYACEMILTIDYQYQEIGFLSYSTAETLTIDNITYDSVIENFVYLEYSENSTYYILYYACLTGDYCEWEYAQQIIPQLVDLNYQPLYNLLLPKVSNSNGRPNITQCYNNIELVNCSSGSCEFLQRTNDGSSLLISRDCAIFRESTVEIGQVRYTPGPTKHDYDTIDFTCNIDECNGEVNEYEIKEIISSKWNESISSVSLGTKFHLTNFSLHFLTLILIQYFK